MIYDVTFFSLQIEHQRKTGECNMKFNGKWINTNYKKKTLTESLEIYNKLTSANQIDAMAYKIAKNAIGSRRNNAIPQTILGLMYPIVFTDNSKNLFDAYGNFIGATEMLSKLNTSDNPFKEGEPNNVYYFSNIQIRKYLSMHVDFLLNFGTYTKEDKILYALVKTVIECAFNTKSSYIPYNTTLSRR